MQKTSKVVQLISKPTTKNKNPKPFLFLWVLGDSIAKRDNMIGILGFNSITLLPWQLNTLIILLSEMLKFSNFKIHKNVSYKYNFNFNEIPFNL